MWKSCNRGNYIYKYDKCPCSTWAISKDTRTHLSRLQLFSENTEPLHVYLKKLWFTDVHLNASWMGNTKTHHVTGLGSKHSIFVFPHSSNFHSSYEKKMKMHSYSKLWGKIDNFPISCNQYFIFMPLLLFTLCFYPNWFCHNRITSYCSTPSKYCASIKASRIFHVKSTRVQMIHSAIMLICYLWTTRRSLHRMSHRSNREACGESSVLPDPHGLKGCFSFEEDFFSSSLMVFMQAILDMVQLSKNTMCIVW